VPKRFRCSADRTGIDRHGDTKRPMPADQVNEWRGWGLREVNDDVGRDELEEVRRDIREAIAKLDRLIEEQEPART
jgi:hypothetical protein